MITKVAFVTNICTHYVIRLFEFLAKNYDVDFYFTGGRETYWEKQNKAWLGNFKGAYLRGLFLFPKFKFTPGLFALPFRKYDVFIKTIDDRFALPFIFFISKILGKPFILWTGHWMHPDTFFHRLSYGFTKYIYRHADAIVVYGEHIRRYLLDLDIPEKKIFVAWHSVDNSRFNKDVSHGEKSKLRSQLEVLDEKIVLSVGRLEECKGLSYLIEALSGINDVRYKLLFIGSGSQQEYLKELCRQLNCPHLFLNHVPNEELYRYYALAHIFVLPSVTTKDFKEPWGLVINEAMNQSCPVVATDAVGAAVGGLIENGINGFVVPERDVLALQRAVRNLLENEELKSRFGQKAKEKILSWTPLKTAEGFLKAVEFALASRS